MEKVKPLKFNFEPLYWTQGTVIQNTPTGTDAFESMVDGGNGDYSGQVASSAWEAVSMDKLNDCYSVNLVNRQTVDLTGLTMQHIALAPLGNSTQRMETFALGYLVDDRGAPIVENVGGAPKIVGRGFIREYVFYTTQPISNETLTSTIFNTSSPVPPFMGLGNLDGSQLVAGYSSTYTRDNSTPAIDGWCVKLQESKQGFGDIINSPTLHCTRVINASLRVKDLSTANCSNSGVTSPLFLDVPFSCEVITVAEIEPDTVEYFATMARSLQPPEANQ